MKSKKTDSESLDQTNDQTTQVEQERPVAPAPAAVEQSGKSIVYKRVPIDSVYEDPANARKHGDANMSAIIGSLRQFGQVESLVVQASTGKVIGGNGRLRAMKTLGWTEVDIALTDINNSDATVLGIALNRTAELAEWNEDVLGQLVTSIETEDEDLKKMLAGIDDEFEFSKLIEQPEAPQGFPTVDENIETEHQCPNCGYRYSGGKPVPVRDFGNDAGVFEGNVTT